MRGKNTYHPMHIYSIIKNRAPIAIIVISAATRRYKL